MVEKIFEKEGKEHDKLFSSAILLDLYLEMYKL